MHLQPTKEYNNFTKCIFHAFDGQIYPKQLVVHFSIFYLQYVCSLGIRTMTFAMLCQQCL